MRNATVYPDVEATYRRRRDGQRAVVDAYLPERDLVLLRYPRGTVVRLSIEQFWDQWCHENLFNAERN